MFLLLLGRHGSFYEKSLRNEHRWQENISTKYYLNNFWKIVYQTEREKNMFAKRGEF